MMKYFLVFLYVVETTFLNALSGRATYGKVTGKLQGFTSWKIFCLKMHIFHSGKVLINGQPDTVEAISRLVGFVPQVNFMHFSAVFSRRFIKKLL
jgi:hypothetical protein